MDTTGTATSILYGRDRGGLVFISRQRAWGVPLPIFYLVKTMNQIITPEKQQTMLPKLWGVRFQCLVERAAVDFCPSRIYTSSVLIISLQRYHGMFGLDPDLLMKQSKRKSYLSFPAGYYLEGSVSISWFNSSIYNKYRLLCVAPYKNVLSKNGLDWWRTVKMSKSLCNTCLLTK